MTALAPDYAYNATAGTLAEARWEEMGAQAPTLAATARAYLDQIALSLRASSVVVADAALRTFVGYLIEHHPGVESFRQVGRTEIEGFKLWLTTRPTQTGGSLSSNTIRQRLGTLRTFFDRIIEWDWDDAPARTPIFGSDLPVANDPLPRFLDDGQVVRLLRAAAQADPLRRLVVELLVHTGMRVGELCALEADAVVQIGDGWWLRIPLGKLHNDRYVPLTPALVERLAAWVEHHDHHGTGLLVTKAGVPLNRSSVVRILNRVAKAAGIGHVHPHQLRHTLATQAINRGMRLEAIAALLGHRSLRMTMVYARIANRTVADEYQAVAAKVEALYSEPERPKETGAMRRLRTEHRRMLANGWCTRPAEMDCTFESLCEGCGFFETTVEFRPTLAAQRDHAAAHGQEARQARYQSLLDGLNRASG